MKKIAVLLIFLIFCGCAKSLPDKGGDNVFTKQENPIATPFSRITLLDSTKDLSDKKIGWGLKRNLGAAPTVDSSSVELLKKYNSYYIGDTGSKDIYLTFDEGYENGYTAKILDVLKKHFVPAAFFVTGPYLKTERDLVKRMVNEGHVVANHTVNHPSLPEISEKELTEELLQLDRIFYEDFGRHMDFVRPPKGEFSEKSLYLTQALGYKTIMWSFAYEDWYTDRQKGAAHAYKQVTDHLHGGEIILLHAVSSDNAEAMEQIIVEARKKGFVFKSLYDLPK